MRWEIGCSHTTSGVVGVKGPCRTETPFLGSIAVRGATFPQFVEVPPRTERMRRTGLD